MKRFVLLLAFLIAFCAVSLAQSNPPLTIREATTGVGKTNASALVFPNASLSIDGGIVTVTFSGGAGTVTHTAGVLTLNDVIIGNGAADLKASGIQIVNVPLLNAANVFTTVNEFRQNGLAATQVNGLLLNNQTAALVGVQTQNSPALQFSGTQWNDSTVQSDSYDFRMFLTGELNPANNKSRARLSIQTQKNGGGFAEVATMEEGAFLATAVGSLPTANGSAVLGGPQLLFVDAAGEDYAQFIVYQKNVFGDTLDTEMWTTDYVRFNDFNHAGGTTIYELANTPTEDFLTLYGYRLTTGGLIKGKVPAAGFTGDLIKITDNAGSPVTLFTVSAAGNLILGGGTTAAELRFLEPSASGTNYSAFKAVAQGSNITYSLPPTVGAAGTVLTDVAGNGVLTWASGGANTALSNLASVAINTDLLPASTQGLGNASFPFLASFTGNTTQYESVTQSAGLITHTAAGSATNIGFVFTPKGTGGATFSIGGNTWTLGASSIASSSAGAAITAASGGSLTLGAPNGNAFLGNTSSFGATMVVGSGGAKITNASYYAFSSTTDSFGTVDLLLTRAAAANLQLGAATSATAAVAQTLSVQGSSGNSAAAALFTVAGSDQSGTGTNGGGVTIRAGNTTGASGTRNGGALTLQGGTGATIGGSIIFQTAATTSLATIFTLGPTQLTLGNAGTAITNVRHGISGAMVLGTVTVTDTGCTANTRYFFSAHSLGTVSLAGGYYASTRTANTSFVITSSQATETSTIDWIAVEP